MAESSLRERTAKGLFWGGISGGVQQILALVIGIVLARHLLPADYGMVAMLTVFSLLAANLEESGFTSAIAIKKNVGDRDYNAVLWFSLILSVVLYGVLWFAAPLISMFNHTPELTKLARVSFLGFVVSSLGIAQSAYLFRNLMVKQRMIATFIAVCTAGVVGIVLVLRGFAYWGLVAQDLTYKFMIVLMYWTLSPWRPRMQFDLKPIREMFGFSSKILATNVLTTLNNQFLQAQLGHYFPRHEVGLYSQANKWNTMGYSLITTTMSSVAQPVLAKAGEESRQKLVFRKMVRFTSFLSFPAMPSNRFDNIRLEIRHLSSNRWLICHPARTDVVIQHVRHVLVLQRKRARLCKDVAVWLLPPVCRFRSFRASAEIERVTFGKLMRPAIANLRENLFVILTNNLEVFRRRREKLDIIHRTVDVVSSLQMQIPDEQHELRLLPEMAVRKILFFHDFHVIDHRENKAFFCRESFRVQLRFPHLLV